MLELRLAENDRTLAPEWARYAHQLVGGAAGAAGAAGLPVPPGGLVDELVNQLARLDRDDLILIWRADVAELAPALSAAPPRLLRLSLATTRRASAGSDKDAPAAELDLLLYREPEPGCP